MARRRKHTMHNPTGLMLGDLFKYSGAELKRVEASRLRANGRRGRVHARHNAYEYVGQGALSNPHRDELLAISGYHGRVLWPRYEPGGGVNSGDDDYVTTVAHGSLFTRDINLLRNGGGTYMGMRVTSARFNGTCKMTGNPYERGEEIVKVPDVGWCSLSAVKAQSARENRGRRKRSR